MQFSEYVSFPRFDLDLDLDLDLDMVVDISLFNVKNKYYDQQQFLLILVVTTDTREYKEHSLYDLRKLVYLQRNYLNSKCCARSGSFV